MAGKEKNEGMLSPYRVLDLTDEKGLLCGKLLGDLGADVIKVERPGGDPARNIGPFYHDEADPEKSLFWWSFNTNKRGITLDIETTGGQETFKELVKGADFVIESFPPGYMDRLGLGYSILEEHNPGIIMVSISPFGQTGPYKDYEASDIISWAMGGYMGVCGEEDRPPVRISHPCQAYLHASAEAAVGAMLALHYREVTGEGQWVDVSIQACAAQLAYGATVTWDTHRVVRHHGMGRTTNVNIHMSILWPCQDGFVIWIYFPGPNGKPWNLPLVNWIEDEGMADDFFKGFDWDTFVLETITQEVVDRLVESTRKFFMAHTKSELYEGALKYRAMVYPVSTTADLLNSVQLATRGFWVELEHPELGTTITYPGAFAHASETPPRLLRRAPLIGEHNREVFEQVSGIAKQEPLLVRQAKRYPVRPDEKSDRKNANKKLLDGIIVADFTRYGAGPIATKTLSSYGAEVIRIEGRSRPDVERLAGPFKDNIPGFNRGAAFNQLNTGKLSVALNLAHPRGVELAKRLVAEADIVAENFAGGAMEKMGLGYDELKKVKPDIIMLSTCMQGQTGPHATRPGFGWHATALSGFYHLTGWPDREPVGPDGPYTDMVAPRLNVLAILAALDYRCRTGKGQYLDMSQYENGIHFMAPLVLDYTVNGRVANRMGNRSTYAAPHGAYRCRGDDRWCAIAVFTDEEWRSFVKVIGSPAWTEDPKFSSLPARKKNEDELDKLVEEWTISYSPEEVMAVMQAAGVGAGVVETGDDIMEYDPQLKHRHFFWEVDHPEVGKHRVPGSSLVLSKATCELRRSPLLGEHNEYILKEILNISNEEIAELVIEGVVE